MSKQFTHSLLLRLVDTELNVCLMLKIFVQEKRPWWAFQNYKNLVLIDEQQYSKQKNFGGFLAHLICEIRIEIQSRLVRYGFCDK